MSHDEPPRSVLLGRGDQTTIAALVLVGLVAVALYWFLAGGASGNLVELDGYQRPPAAFRVDINTAAWPELAELPGIGETLARRIVESREQQGPFESLEDLDRVPGIGPKTLAELRPLLVPISP
jgi:competence protein ComEA